MFRSQFKVSRFHSLLQMQEKYFQYIYLQKYKVNFKKHNFYQESLLGSSFHSLEEPLGFNVSLLRVQHLSKS